MNNRSGRNEVNLHAFTGRTNVYAVSLAHRVKAAHIIRFSLVSFYRFHAVNL